MRYLFKSSRLERGVAAVEFGIVLIVLIPLVFGMTEYGRAMYQYNALVKSTRNAARFLSQQAPGDPADIATAVCLAKTGTPDCSSPVLVPGLTDQMISICDSQSCPSTHAAVQTGSGAVNLVTVTIGGANSPFPFTSLVPSFITSFYFGPISTTMRQTS